MDIIQLIDVHIPRLIISNHIKTLILFLLFTKAVHTITFLNELDE